MEMSHTLKDDNNEGIKPDVFNGDTDTSAKDKDLLQKLTVGCLKHAQTGARKDFKGRWML